MYDDVFELAFLIDQGVNISRLSLMDAIENALDLFLSPLAILVNPERKRRTREVWSELGLREFNSWRRKESTMPKRMYESKTGEFKAVIVLRLLMRGGIIEHNSRLWALTDDYRVGCLVLDMEKTTKDKLIPLVENDTYKVVPVLDNQLEDFLHWAEDLPDETISTAIANMVLNEINANGGRVSHIQYAKERRYD